MWAYIILSIVIIMIVIILLIFLIYAGISMNMWIDRNKTFNDLDIGDPIHHKSKKFKCNSDTINILIRTSKRKKAFNRCIDSIKRQNFDNYRIIVSVDNDKTLEYVKKCDMINDILIFDQNDARDFRWNLYFNYMMNICNSGWIIFLDDDNILNDSDALNRIIKNVDNPDLFYIFNCRRKAGIFKINIPNNNTQKLPTHGNVDTACFVINHKYKNKYKWRSRKGGDYNYMESATTGDNKISFIRVYNHFILNTGSGLGKQKDI